MIGDDLPLVLVAEDEATSRRLMAKIITRLGFPVVLASDGEMALRLIEINPGIDILVTDENMPKMLGTELVASLRRRPQFDYLGIAIVSGVLRMQDVSNLLDAGADRFIPKPVDPKVLSREIASLRDEVKKRRKRPAQRATG